MCPSLIKVSYQNKKARDSGLITTQELRERTLNTVCTSCGKQIIRQPKWLAYVVH